MSLALAVVPVSDFDNIYNHLTITQVNYLNMHLREACQRDGKRDLRYLHAMAANPNVFEIKGKISGLNIFVDYKLIKGPKGTQLIVISERGSPKEIARLGKRFLKEILARVELEKSGAQYHPKRTPGQFYLKRGMPGMAFGHPNCQAAVSLNILDPSFVRALSAWNFVLLYP